MYCIPYPTFAQLLPNLTNNNWSRNIEMRTTPHHRLSLFYSFTLFISFMKIFHCSIPLKTISLKRLILICYTSYFPLLFIHFDHDSTCALNTFFYQLISIHICLLIFGSYWKKNNFFYRNNYKNKKEKKSIENKWINSFVRIKKEKLIYFVGENCAQWQSTHQLIENCFYWCY